MLPNSFMSLGILAYFCADLDKDLLIIDRYYKKFNMNLCEAKGTVVSKCDGSLEPT